MKNAITIETSAQFEAAHRQLGDPGKCGGLHGHNWLTRFVVSGRVTSELGYLVDFKSLKAIVQKYDHRTLLVQADPLIEGLQSYGQPVCVLPLNPTCENIAQLIADEVQEMCVSLDVDFISVTVYENDQSTATASWTSPLVI